jgi:ribonucleoside-triphosphate reductase
MNLPRYAFLEKDIDGVLDRVQTNMEMAKEVMALRVDIFNKNVENGMMKFLSQKDKNGEPYYRVENGTHSFGFVGIEEMLLNLGIEEGLSSKEGQKLTHTVLDYINETKDKWKEEDNIRYSVLGSPAESASGRLAALDIKHYGVENYNGTKEAPYYSNSSHLNVNKDIDLLDRIKIESQFHKKIGGGQILHLWLGQKPTEICLNDLSRIIKNNDARYWTYTNDYSTCTDCNYSYNGLGELCPSCGSSKTISYSKISGYIQKIENWNKSKRSELIDRHRY